MERVQAIFEYASELAPEEREKFLQQVCSEEPDLLAEVRLRLEQAHADTVELRAEGAPPLSETPKFIFAPGDLIASRYVVIRAIAKGGMGEVYEVDDYEFRIRVALKTISLKSAARPGAFDMFRREILLARHVTHPNVCRIYDLGHHNHPEYGDMVFLTMELLNGETLVHRVRNRGTFTKQEALPLLHQMIQALSAAHRLNIAHRDFKSGNVMLCEAVPLGSGSVPLAGDVAIPASQSDTRPTPASSARPDTPSSDRSDGVQPPSAKVATASGASRSASGSTSQKGVIIKVTDFGLARSVDGLETTVHGEVWGTPDYMAPEQFHGQSSTASDIYSLGVVIYEMFTAKLPHRSSSGSGAPDGKPSTAMESIPAEWRPVVKKCMAYDPGDRYATADEVWAALNEEAPADTGRGIISKLSRRLVATIALALVAVLGGTAFVERDAIRHFFHPPAEPRHIAVLPFHNVGDDPANQAFCDGVAYSLSSKLSQLQDFQTNYWIIPADDTHVVRSPDEAYRKLNADLVLTGSVQRTSSGATVTINLVDAKNHRQLASRVLTASVGTLDTLQASAWEAAASMVDMQVNSAAKAQLARQDTKQPGAYEYYTQGVGYIERVHSDSSDVDSAIQMFSRALEIDRNYALAYAGLGRAYALKYHFTRDPQWFEKASVNGRRAVELDKQLGPARYTLARTYQQAGRLDDALEEYQAALQLDPRTIEASFHIAEIYEAKNQFAEAEAQFKRVIADRPGLSSAYLGLGRLYFNHGDFQAAEQQFQTVIKVTPDNPLGYQDLAAVYMTQDKYEQAISVLRSELKLKSTAGLWSQLGAALMFVKRYPEAVDAMEHAAQLASHDHDVWRNLGDSYRQVPGQQQKAADAYTHALAAAKDRLKVSPSDADAISGVALYQAHLGDRNDAKKNVSRAVALAPSDNNVLFTSALVYELVGSRDQALAAIDKAWKSGYALSLIEREPELESLRADPRYRSWLQGARKSNSTS